MLDLGENLTLSFQVFLLDVWALSPEIWIIIGSVESNVKFSDNPGHNVLEQCFSTGMIRHKSNETWYLV